jgi:hypothetical protein
MFQLGKRDWIVLTAFIAAIIVGYGIYARWIGPEAGLHRIEGNLKSNLPLRVDPNKTLVDVKYERNHSSYWYVIENADQFDAQETARSGIAQDRRKLEKQSDSKRSGGRTVATSK